MGKVIDEAAPAAQDPLSPKHDDWLLDEALSETFPASDPISPAVPVSPRPA